MKKTALFFLLVLTSFRAGAADYYWVGGGGSWSDLNHWRLGSSVGSLPSIVPSASDNVFFTSASGFGATVPTRTVSLDANGFCNNMTWDLTVPNNPIFSRSIATYKLEVWNNLSLAPNVNYQQSFVFKGGNTSSFTTNGIVDGVFAFDIDKAGGTLNLVDSFVSTSSNINNNIILTAGTFNAAGKVIRAYQFNSNNSNLRVLNITGTTLAFSNQWNFRGINKTLTAAGSLLTANSALLIDGGTYNEVACNGIFDGDMLVSNAVISKLTYTNVFTGSFATVTNSNIIDTVVFKGRGRIYNNNRIMKLIFEASGSILGNKNIIGTVLAQAKFQISSTDTTTVDSLLLAANQIAALAGTININKYMKAQGAQCQAFTEVTATDSARLYFAPTASALIDNVFLTNIIAFGNITPIAVSGVDGGNNPGFNITAPASLSGTTLYWVGGAGDWNDNAHWSYASGGAGGACIPFISDTVIFNSGSGLTSGNIVATSGNAYCRNVSWLPGVGTSVFNKPAGTRFYVYGSAVLNPAITMGSNVSNAVLLEFVGSENTSTITFNGSSLGVLGLTVNKTGTGALTFADNWFNVNGTIVLTAGRLNMSGRTVNIQSVSSNNNSVRNVDIIGANIRVGSTWAYTGSNNNLAAAGSRIISDLFLNITNRYYPYLELTYGGATTVFNISQCTIDSLTFINTSATSTAQVNNNNTIRRLEFKGAGNITGNNTIDSLILAGSRNYLFGGTTTLNKYLLAVSPTCTGLLEMKGNTAGTFQFNPSALISMANVYLQNMTATGVPPVAFNGADAGGNSGWNITSPAGTPRYWIGGSGDWNDASHWSLTSGGAGAACIPTVYDDVFFNASSGFTGASRTVTVNNGNAYAHNVDWTGATNNPIWSKATAWTIEVWGNSVVLNPTATFTVAPITFKGNTNTTMTGSVLGNFDLRIQKPVGTFTLANNYSNPLTDIILNDGTLDVANRILVIGSMSNEGLANTMSINMTNANLTLDSVWRYNGTVTGHTLAAAGATLTAKIFNALGMSYNNVNVSGTTNTSGVLSNTVISRLVFTNSNTASLAGISGTSNTIGTLDYKGGGGIYGTGNVIDTLIFYPGNTYILNAGTNTTVNKGWYGSGTPCRLTEIQSSSATANATVTVTAGDVDFDYIRLRRITAAGAAQPFIARQHSIDQLNNTNWNIAPYDGASAIYGLGPDTALFAAAFPYTLGTDGFFGTPSSLYTWNDNSTQNRLTVIGPGTYSVTVNFVDGCTINDAINISLRSPLPISLAGFAASMQNCSANLKWSVSDAVNFNQFVVERSNDGVKYNDLATVGYAKGVGSYNYTDKALSKGKLFYRLRLMDNNGSYQYSSSVIVTSDCASNRQVAIMPNPTKGMININGLDDEKNNIVVNDALGRTIYSTSVDGKLSTSIDLARYAKGVYIVRITSEKGASSVVKVVKD